MPIVEVRNLHKSFAKTVALENVDFSVNEGEVFGILGPNGAGKTTTVECMTGMLTADSGELSVLGLDPAKEVAELRRLVGYQLQSSELMETMRVGEALNLFASFYPDPLRPADLLDTVGLSRQRTSAFKSLSGGQKQRLSIALALIGNPRIAVLDELTTGLDPQGRRDIWRLIDDIRHGGVTIVLVTHFLDEAQALCDRLTIIDNGRTIATGTPQELVDLACPNTAERTGGDRTVGEHPRTLEDAYLTVIANHRQQHQQGRKDAL